MDMNVIKSYLVELGFKVDHRSLSHFTEGLKKASQAAEESTKGIAKGFLLAGTTVAGAMATIAAGTVGLMNHVAKGDLDMQVFARRMYMSTDAARKMKMATDALGYSVEEILWGPPELAERYHQLLTDQNKMLETLGGADFEKQMRGLRDIRFEFTRLGLGIEYFSMLFVRDLSKALWGDENGLQNRLEHFVSWFEDNMPSISHTLATDLAPAFHELWKSVEGFGTALTQVDWVTLIKNVTALSTELLKVMTFITQHPLLAKSLLGAGAGGMAAGPYGAAIGAASGTAWNLVDETHRGHKAPWWMWALSPITAYDMNQVAKGMNSSDVRKQIAAAARAAGLDPALALAVAREESSFNPYALNRKSGAMGLFQLMPGTAAALGVNPNDPTQNIAGGVQYLNFLLKKYHGDVAAALKEYGGFVNTDPSGYIGDIMRYRNQYSTGSVQPMAYHQSISVGDINIMQPNATPEQIQHAVKKAIKETSDNQTHKLLAQQAGVYA